MNDIVLDGTNANCLQVQMIGSKAPKGKKSVGYDLNKENKRTNDPSIDVILDKIKTQY